MYKNYKNKMLTVKTSMVKIINYKQPIPLPLDLIILIKSYIPAYRMIKWLVDTYLINNQKIIKKFNNYIINSYGKYQVKNIKLTMDNAIKVLIKLIKHKCINSKDVYNLANSLNRFGLEVETMHFVGSDYIGSDLLLIKVGNHRYSVLV